MNCGSRDEWMDAYLDGELRAELGERADAHLEGCADCRRELASRRQLLTAARHLGGIEPPRDLWPGVARRIAAERRPTARWVSLAAAAALTAALALPVVWKLTRPNAARPIAPSTEAVDRSDVARWRDGTTLARSDLIRMLERQRDLLPPETVASMEENLETLDRAVAQISAALDEDPSNRHLSSLLATRYQQEARLLNRISRI